MEKLTLASAQRFIKGGNATFTVVSGVTQNRFTFRARVLKPSTKEGGEKPSTMDLPVFVSLLTNGGEKQYTFMGTIFNQKRYNPSAKSRISSDAPSQKAFMYIFNAIVSGNENDFAKFEFWHEGRCCECGRKLTDPLSIRLGIGPVCGGHEGTLTNAQRKAVKKAA